MRMRNSSAPKAILTQLILATLLTLVTETNEVGATASRARDRMHDTLHGDEAMKDVEPDEARGPDVRQSHAEKVFDADWCVLQRE